MSTPSVRGPAASNDLAKSIRSDNVSRSERRLDNWSNVFTGVGIQNIDSRLSTRPSVPFYLTEMDLEDIWRANGLGKRLISLPSDEMTRAWFNILGDAEGKINRYLSELEIPKYVNILVKWAKLFGGAIMVLGLDDSQRDLTKPVNLRSLRGIKWIRIYDRYRCPISTYDLVQEPDDPRFLMPRYYRIWPLQSQQNFVVHESRVIRLDGAILPDRSKVNNEGWGDSDLQAAYDSLRSLGGIYDSTELMMQDFSQAVLKVKDLAEMISDEDGYKNVLKRLELLRMSRHIINMAIMDMDEDYQKHSTSITGVPEIIDRAVQRLAASANPAIPITLLMGVSPAGLNATGASDIRNWYDSIRRLQETWLEPVIRRIVFLSMISKDGPTRGVELKDWSIEYNPLWQPTEKEIADTRLVVAQTDDIYLRNGVVDEVEVAISRFGGDEYSMETELAPDANDFKTRSAMIEQEEEDAKQNLPPQLQPGSPDPKNPGFVNPKAQ